SAHQEVLWEYYYMGFQYSENRRNEALAARPAAPSSISVPPPPAPVPVPVPAPAPAETTPAIPRIAYKVKDPETFSGELQKFRNFTSQLDLVFVSDPAGFSEDQRKIVYAASYLRGSAYSWFEGQGLAAFPSYNTFLEKLRSAFSDPNPENT